MRSLGVWGIQYAADWGDTHAQAMTLDELPLRGQGGIRILTGGDQS